MEEFRSCLDEELVLALFTSLEIDFADAETFFQALVSMSETNDVDVDTFVEACTKLQGDAKRADVQVVAWELEQLNKRSTRFMKFFEEEMVLMKDIDQQLKFLKEAAFCTP